jgi:hypothetical protein
MCRSRVMEVRKTAVHSRALGQDKWQESGGRASKHLINEAKFVSKERLGQDKVNEADIMKAPVALIGNS